jgi:phenylpropionate dioxygenase-like ring-hydroxylating dioxygenase large terminal subunit
MQSIDLDHLVQPDRVHKSVYTDQKLFDLEMEHIFEKAWVYCGHESQVKEVGDYFTMQIGRQPMVMVRDIDNSVKVLYNRCPHRGVELCGNQSGNTGKGFVCSYHAWSFHLNGKVKAIPLFALVEGHVSFSIKGALNKHLVNVTPV